MHRYRPHRVNDNLPQAVLYMACAALLLNVAGCSTRNDPNYNPYSSLHGGRPVTQRIEDAMNSAQGALDNLDARIENAGY